MGVVGIANWQFVQFLGGTRILRVVHGRDARATLVSETLVFEASQCQNLRRVPYYRVLI